MVTEDQAARSGNFGDRARVQGDTGVGVGEELLNRGPGGLAESFQRAWLCRDDGQLHPPRLAARAVRGEERQLVERQWPPRPVGNDEREAADAVGLEIGDDRRECLPAVAVGEQRRVSVRVGLTGAGRHQQRVVGQLLGR